MQTPAVHAALPGLVPEDQLMRYNGLNATMQSVANFAAPAAAGLVLSVGSLRSVLLIDVATAALGIGLFACVRLPQERRKERVAAADIRLGIRYALSERAVRGLLMVYGFFVFLSVPAGLLAQLFVSRTFGDTYWHMTAVEVIGVLGMILGGALMSAWGGFSSRRRTLAFGLLCFGLLTLGLSASRNFYLYLGFMLAYGIAMTMVQTAVATGLQEEAAPDMLGRVCGLMVSMYCGFLPIGMLVVGPLADLIPLRSIMAVAGAAVLLVAAGYASFSKKRMR